MFLTQFILDMFASESVSSDIHTDSDADVAKKREMYQPNLDKIDTPRE
jgi:hypothetical protein